MENSFTCTKKGVLKNLSQLISQEQIQSTKNKQKRCASLPLICTTAFVRANTDKQSFAVLIPSLAS